MRLGVLILPELRWAEAEPLWRRAEQLGFEHAWTYDHLAWRGLRDDPWFAAIPTLTAAAMVTERIRLGPLVASPTFRHPVPFAKELVALDDVSRGRLTLGIGAGSSDGWDATMLGPPAWSRRERSDRFTEFVELTDRLLRTGAVSSRGRFYSAAEARTYPGCVQTPRLPFAIAATGPRGMDLAVRQAQTWVTTGDPRRGEGLDAVEGVGVVGEQMQRLDQACLETGRDPASLERLVLTGAQLDAGLASASVFDDTIGRYAEAGVTDFVVHWPRPSQPYAGELTTFEQIVSRPR